MLPFSVPPVVMLAVLMETVKLAGVLPLAGETLSHELPEVTDAFTLVLFGDEVIVRVCELGGVRPMV